MTGPLHIELMATADALPLWAELQARVGEVPLAASEVWTRSWLEVFGDLVPHRCAVGRLGGPRGEAVALCLVTEGIGQKDGPLPVRTLHLGTAGEPPDDSVCVEYNEPLALADAREPFLVGLLARLHDEAGWDALYLDGLPEELAALSGVQGARASICLHDSPCFELQPEWREAEGGLLAHLGRSTRKNLRRNLNAFGELRVDWSDSASAADAMLDDLIRLHQLRWRAQGEPGAFASARFERFHRLLLGRLVPEGRAALVRVSNDWGLVGCVYLLIDRGRALFYQSGWVQRDGRSPGLLVDYLCMEACLERGLSACDFLVGDSRHKRSLSNTSAQLAWVKLSRPGSLKLAALGAVRRVKRLLVDRGG